MYHIKNDKRQIATADHIMEGLTKCLATKAMSELSVTDIATASNVSRSTFYRSFDTPIDVLIYACDKEMKDLIKDYAGVKFENRDDFVLYSLKYWAKHSDLLEAVVNCDRLDIIQKTLESESDKFIVGIKDEIYKEFTQNEIDYLMMGVVGLVTNMLLVWIRHGKRETPEQLFTLYKKLYKIDRNSEEIVQMLLNK